MKAEINTPLIDEGFGPEDVAMLDRVLAAACAEAGRHIEIGEGVRTMLASAVIAGAQRNIRQPDELAQFALRSLPALRGVEAG